MSEFSPLLIKNVISLIKHFSFRTLLNSAIIDVLKKSNTVCTTCIGSADNNLMEAGIKFDVALIDEAAQLTVPECLVPIIQHKTNQIILIGDHKQLSPVVSSSEAILAGFEISLFERLMQQREENRIILVKINLIIARNCCPHIILISNLPQLVFLFLRD